MGSCHLRFNTADMRRLCAALDRDAAPPPPEWPARAWHQVLLDRSRQFQALPDAPWLANKRHRTACGDGGAFSPCMPMVVAGACPLSSSGISGKGAALLLPPLARPPAAQVAGPLARSSNSSNSKGAPWCAPQQQFPPSPPAGSLVNESKDVLDALSQRQGAPLRPQQDLVAAVKAVCGLTHTDRLPDILHVASEAAWVRRTSR